MSRAWPPPSRKRARGATLAALALAVVAGSARGEAPPAPRGVRVIAPGDPAATWPTALSPSSLPSLRADVTHPQPPVVVPPAPTAPPPPVMQPPAPPQPPVVIVLAGPGVSVVLAGGQPILPAPPPIPAWPWTWQPVLLPPPPILPLARVTVPAIPAQAVGTSGVTLTTDVDRPDGGVIVHRW